MRNIQVVCLAILLLSRSLSGDTWSLGSLFYHFSWPSLTNFLLVLDVNCGYKRDIRHLTVTLSVVASALVPSFF